MKKEYTQPELIMMELAEDDVIRTSGGTTEGGITGYPTGNFESATW